MPTPLASQSQYLKCHSLFIRLSHFSVTEKMRINNMGCYTMKHYSICELWLRCANASCLMCCRGFGISYTTNSSAQTLRGSVIHSVKSAVDHYSSSLRLPNCSINFSLRPWLGTSVLGYLINVATPHCSLCVSCYSIFQLLVIIFVVCDACVDM